MIGSIYQKFNFLFYKSSLHFFLNMKLNITPLNDIAALQQFDSALCIEIVYNQCPPWLQIVSEGLHGGIIVLVIIKVSKAAEQVQRIIKFVFFINRTHIPYFEF